MTSPSPRFVVDDSARDPDATVWFAEPAGFTVLPLHALTAAPGSPGAEQLRTALTPLLDAAPDEVARQRFIAQLAAGQQMMVALAEVGTVHCSIGMHRDDTDEAEGGAEGGDPLISFFTVSWRDTAWSPRAVTAARAVAAAEGHSDIEYVELACGPASLGETVRTAASDSGLPQGPLLQVHAYAPHPDGRRLAVLTLSTTAVGRREHYRRILRQIAETVSFDNPLAAG